MTDAEVLLYLNLCEYLWGVGAGELDQDAASRLCAAGLIRREADGWRLTGAGRHAVEKPRARLSEIQTRRATIAARCLVEAPPEPDIEDPDYGF